MKEMIYYDRRLSPPEILAEGKYNGLHYYVINLGTHPCAYVDVTDTKLNRVDYCELDYINCHGGLTYSASYLGDINDEGWFIGWDYMHYGDRVGWGGEEDFLHGRKWTTEEIVEECKEVIDQIVEIERGEKQ